MEELCCPKDGMELESLSGDFVTGVQAPDGCEEFSYVEGLVCPLCETVYKVEDLEEAGKEL